MNEPIIPGGYILISRKIVESQIFNKPPLYLKVWIYLLSRAQHSEYKLLKRGQLRISIPELQEVCSWKVGYRKAKPTYKEIRDVIDWLRNPHDGITEGTTEGNMIVTTKGTHGMLINIGKYGFYQNPNNYEWHDESLDEGNMKEERRAGQGHNINKNDKECYKNEKEEVIPNSVVEIYGFYKETFQGYYKAISLTPGRKKSIQTRLKKYSAEQIKEAISNIRKSKYHLGEDPNNDKFYATLEFICRNDETIEKWINYQPKPEGNKGYEDNKARKEFNLIGL